MVDTLFKKETDCQDYLHRKSEHPESLKHSIPYAQVLRLKWICTEDCNFKGNCDILLKNLIGREYKKAEPFDRNRENLLTQNNELKGCVHYFLSNFYFSPNDSCSKSMKNVFYFI